MRLAARQVLQDSLCGSAKVLLVCCVSPDADSTSETLSSLNFATRAGQVELGPVRRAADAGCAGAVPGSLSNAEQLNTNGAVNAKANL